MVSMQPFSFLILQRLFQPDFPVSHKFLALEINQYWNLQDNM